jgi:hypothetical protein
MAMEADEMTLIRSRQSLEAIRDAFHSGNVDKALRSYYIPEYQQRIIDILQAESGKSKGHIVRDILDEWVEMQLSEIEREASGQ